jgi:hypothetical protein
MKKMTKRMFVAGLTIAVVWMGFTSCEKTTVPQPNTIDGNYLGSFSISSSLKSSHAGSWVGGPDTAVVTLMGDHQIEVHCFGETLDTTFMLDYYENNDSVMVCLTGNDFSTMYGHMLGAGHMSGGMMGDINQGETQWMHHLSDEHHSGDEHFGGFDMNDGSFTYFFRLMEGTTPYYLKFHGVKE